MPAQVKLNRLTGPTGSVVYTDVVDTTFRASLSDNPSPGNDYVLELPNPGQVIHSFWVSLQLETTTAPDILLDNVRISTDGDNDWTGVEAHISLASSYVQATGVQGSYGNQLNDTNHSSLLFDPVPLSNFTFSDPLIMDASTYQAEKFGEIIVLQLTGKASAVAGTLHPEALRIRWDEH